MHAAAARPVTWHPYKGGTEHARFSPTKLAITEREAP